MLASSTDQRVTKFLLLCELLRCIQTVIVSGSQVKFRVFYGDNYSSVDAGSIMPEPEVWHKGVRGLHDEV